MSFLKQYSVSNGDNTIFMYYQTSDVSFGNVGSSDRRDKDKIKEKAKDKK